MAIGEDADDESLGVPTCIRGCPASATTSRATSSTAFASAARIVEQSQLRQTRSGADDGRRRSDLRRGRTGGIVSIDLKGRSTPA